jgi:hypothetical protein
MRKVEPHEYGWPRGLSREEAAKYIGVGATLFGEMVSDTRMPHPKEINSRRVWDRRQVDNAFAPSRPKMIEIRGMRMTEAQHDRTS